MKRERNKERKGKPVLKVFVSEWFRALNWIKDTL
jgi:hypothetical protein